LAVSSCGVLRHKLRLQAGLDLRGLDCVTDLLLRLSLLLLLRLWLGRSAGLELRLGRGLAKLLRRQLANLLLLLWCHSELRAELLLRRSCLGLRRGRPGLGLHHLLLHLHLRRRKRLGDRCRPGHLADRHRLRVHELPNPLPGRNRRSHRNGSLQQSIRGRLILPRTLFVSQWRRVISQST
jgi:hypothetical protein